MSAGTTLFCALSGRLLTTSQTAELLHLVRFFPSSPDPRPIREWRLPFEIYIPFTPAPWSPTTLSPVARSAPMSYVESAPSGVLPMPEAIEAIGIQLQGWPTNLYFYSSQWRLWEQPSPVPGSPCPARRTRRNRHLSRPATRTRSSLYSMWMDHPCRCRFFYR